MVSNPDPNANHPGVKNAGVLRSIAQTLAGNPQTVSIDPTTGTVTRTPAPVTGKSLALAIALEAISGSISGLSARGPNAAAQAAQLGFQQGQQQARAAQQQTEQQAQQDADSQASALARQAAITNTNFQMHQNALRLGQLEYDTHNQYVTDSAPVLDALEQVGAIKAQGVHENELLPGYHVAKDMAVVDGVVPRMNQDGTQAKNPDGSLAWDNTYSVIDPDSRIAMPAATMRLLADYRVPGYFKMQDGKSVPVDIPANFPIKARMVVDGLATASAIRITEASINQQLKGMKDGDAEAQQFNLNLKDSLADGSVTPKSLRTFARYGGQPLDLALAAMQRDKVDPNTIGQIASLIPNGALEQLKQQRVTAEEKAKRDADAAAEVEKQKALIPIRAQTAGAEERARQNARGGTSGAGPLNIASLSPKEYQSIVDGIGTNAFDASQMLRYGKADQLKILSDVRLKYPGFNSGQYQANLALAKWATSGKGGDQIQALNTLHDHADDFRENMQQLGNLDSSLLNTPINRLKNATGNPNVPALVGRMLAVRTEYLNALNNNHALSVDDKKDATRLLNENQSPAQWAAVMSQITGTADIRGAETNARYRATFGKDMPNYRNVPPGATMKVPGSDGKLHWSDGKRDLGVAQ